MAKNLLYIIAFCMYLMPLSGRAQYNLNQNKVWAFGDGAGLDFTSGSPVAISTSMYTNEGCASVSDASGHLLFYTDGDTVRNKLGAIMPLGSHVTNFIGGTSSTTQCQIVPVYGNPNQYYVFSLESFYGAYTPGVGQLEYCIVDMSLDGGLGDIVPSTLHTLLDTAMGEHVISVPGNDCNVWLIVHREDSTIFRVYNITAAGITGPVISNVGNFTAYGGYSIGHFEVSPDRTKLISTTYNDGFYVANGVGSELYDFDPATGIVSNCQLLNNTDCVYGAEFSADGSKVYTCQYVTASASTILYQYDISLGSTAAIVASQYAVNTSSAMVFPSLKLACDNKIYLGSMSAVGVSTMDCIPNPNLAGAAAGYTANAVSLVAGTEFIFGLPNLYVVPGAVDSSYMRQDTTVCASVGTITLTAPGGYNNYTWSNGSIGNTTTVSATSDILVLCDSGCHLTLDSVHAHFDPHIVTTQVTDTFFCAPGTFTLTAPAGYGSYTWQDGSTNTSFTDSFAGVYYVDGSSYCQDHIDTFHLVSRQLSINIGNDTTVCMNDLLRVPLAGNDITYRWQDGSTDSVYSADHTGEYSVTVNQHGCTASAQIYVNFFYFSQDIPDTFVCKGTPFNYTMRCNVPEGGSVLWNDGVTTPTRTVSDSGTWWVYVSKDQCEILDTVRVTTGYCNCFLDMPSGFTPNNDGLNDVCRPIIEPGCPVSGYLFSVYNRWGQLIFSSDRQGIGWDGTFKGQPCDIDTYMYSLTYFSGVNNTPVKSSGSIVLIR